TVAVERGGRIGTGPVLVDIRRGVEGADAEADVRGDFAVHAAGDAPHIGVVAVDAGGRVFGLEPADAAPERPLAFAAQELVTRGKTRIARIVRDGEAATRDAVHDHVEDEIRGRHSAGAFGIAFGRQRVLDDLEKR